MSGNLGVVAEGIGMLQSADGALGVAGTEMHPASCRNAAGLSGITASARRMSPSACQLERVVRQRVNREHSTESGRRVAGWHLLERSTDSCTCPPVQYHCAVVFVEGCCGWRSSAVRATPARCPLRVIGQQSRLRECQVELILRDVRGVVIGAAPAPRARLAIKQQRGSPRARRQRHRES